MAKAKADKKPKCFIIMPITRPSAMADCYSDGPGHFTNILNSLFIPSVEAAGFKPDRPTAKGSEIIQSRFIKKLIDADMVLCDMSCLNANVFFEFGIRTALNKPVCVVKDSQSPDVAFDTSIIHYHTYQSPLYAHQTTDEVAALTSHIQDTWTKNKKTNAMWQALGFQLTAQVAEPSGRPDDHILQMLAGITNRLDNMETRSRQDPTVQEAGRIAKTFEAKRRSTVEQCILAILDKDEIEVMFLWEDNDTLTWCVGEKVPEELLSKCQVVGRVLGIAVFEDVAEVIS